MTSKIFFELIWFGEFVQSFHGVHVDKQVAQALLTALYTSTCIATNNITNCKDYGHSQVCVVLYLLIVLDFVIAPIRA
jgi:hypothetical protein